MQRIKVAFLTIAFQRGGAERIISTLSQHLECESILILYEQSSLGYPFKDQVFYLDSNLPTSWTKRFLQRLHRLIRLLAREQTKVLVSFLQRPNILALLLKASGLYRGRLVINEVSMLSLQPIGPKLKWCIARLYPVADLIIVPSQDVLNDLVMKYGVPYDKISVIPNPFNLKEIVLQSLQQISLPWPEDKSPIIISAGRLTALKGFDLLIEAFAVVRSKISVRLVILGNGECESSLRALAVERGLSEDIYFAGWQSNPFAYFKQADMFVLTSQYEGFGNVIVEAMCCGLPVVSTNCPGGPVEILGNGEFGLLVPINDVDALASAMHLVLKDENLRLDLAAKSLRRCRDFDISTVVKRWQEAIECGA